jgi:hypothetical protein
MNSKGIAVVTLICLILLLCYQGFFVSPRIAELEKKVEVLEENLTRTTGYTSLHNILIEHMTRE